MTPETLPAGRTYVVPGMGCSHCKAAIADEVSRVAGVSWIRVDLEAKRVTVRGADLDDASLREAITEAGYEAEP